MTAPETTTPPTPDQTLDAKGLTCPLPLLRAKKALAGMAAGQILKIETTDPGARNDLVAFTRQTGHILLCQQDETLPDGKLVLHSWVRRRPDAPAA